MDWVPLPAQCNSPHQIAGIQAACGRGWEAAKRKREQNRREQQWGDVASISCGGRKLTSGRDGWWGDPREGMDVVPKYVLYQITDTATVHVSHRLTQSRGCTLRDHSPKPCALLIFLLHNRTYSTLQLGTFRTGISFLPEDLSISCWMSYKEMGKVRFWSTGPWIVIMCRIKAVSAFGFTQFLETGVKVENRYQLGSNILLILFWTRS